MGTQNKRPRPDDDDDDRDEDEDRPPKKKSKKEAKGSNTMLLVLGLGGVAALGLLCLCGGGGAGYYFGWFGGGDKKAVAKTDKAAGDKEKVKVDQGPPKGTGPLVTDANFEKAARLGKSLADVEKIMGPGLPLIGADAEKAKAFPVYNAIREHRPDADVYQWSNDRFVYFIFFKGGMYSAHGGDVKK